MVTKSEQLQVGRASARLAQAEYARTFASRGDTHTHRKTSSPRSVL